VFHNHTEQQLFLCIYWFLDDSVYCMFVDGCCRAGDEKCDSSTVQQSSNFGRSHKDFKWGGKVFAAWEGSRKLREKVDVANLASRIRYHVFEVGLRNCHWKCMLECCVAFLSISQHTGTLVLSHVCILHSYYLCTFHWYSFCNMHSSLQENSHKGSCSSRWGWGLMSLHLVS